ncbi:MAG TPA: hypothetical protein VMV86_00900 [Methanosarcinales archaeon]|nr:hypothetical protein [Methanosarcinales archaeon]
MEAIKRKRRMPYTDLENKIILKGREDNKSFKTIAKELKLKLNVDREPHSLMVHAYKKLKGKQSTNFKEISTSNLMQPIKETSTVIKPEVTYKNAYSELKQHTREILVNHIFDNPVEDMRVLSLPADNFLFEKQLKSQFKKRNLSGSLDFLCVEHNEVIYNRGLGEAMTNNFHYVKAEMKDVLPKLTKPFTTIWLDFCCMYNAAVVQCLQTISSNNLLEDNGLLGLTLMYGREPDINSLVPFLKQGERQDMDTLRFKAFPRYVGEVMFHGKVKLQRILKYHDMGESNLAAPMLIYIFQKSDKDFDKKGIIDLKFRPL